MDKRTLPLMTEERRDGALTSPQPLSSQAASARPVQSLSAAHSANAARRTGGRPRRCGDRTAPRRVVRATL